MKRLVLGLLCICPPVLAEPLKTVFNPFTGKLDYITRLDTTSVQAGNNITITSNTAGVVINAAAGGGVSGSVNTATQYSGAYYSIAGSSNVISGSNIFQVYTSSIQVNSAAVYFPGTSSYVGFNAGGLSPPGGSTNNVAFGYSSTDHITSGTGNVGLGYFAHDRLTTGSNNTSIGTGAGNDIISGFGNTCIGGSGGSWQPCQSVLSGSSNTMVGAGTGSTNADSSDTANSFFGFLAGEGAGGAAGPLKGSLCLGANCVVTSSFTAQIGGKLSSGWEVQAHVSSMSVDSSLLGVRGVNYSWPLGVGTGGLFSVSVSSAITFVTSPQLTSTQTWSGANTFSSPSGVAVTYGVVAGSVTASNIATTLIPYSNSGALVGTTNLAWDNPNLAVDLGGGISYTANGLNIDNGANSGSSLLTLNASGGTQNTLMKFLVAGSQTGTFGVLGGGSPDSGPEYRWRLATTNDMMTLDDTGLLSLPAGGGESVTYGITVGSMTGAGLSSCSSASSAVTWNSTTRLFGCNTISGGGGGTSGQVNAAVQFSAPYYSVAGSSNVLSSFTGLILSTNTGITIAVPVLVSSAVTVNSSMTVSGLIQTSTTSALMATNSAGVLISTTVNLAAANVTGVLQSASHPALTGDVTNSAGSLATTAAALQNNITTLGASSITVNGQEVVKSTFTTTFSTTIFNGVQMSWPSTGTTSGFLQYISSNTLQWATPAGGSSSGGGVTVPSTFTWTGVIASSVQVTGGGGLSVTFGTSGSTLTLTNSSTANTLVISSNSTGIALVSVSSAPAFNPNDYILSLASPTVVAPVVFGVQLNGHVVSSGTVPSVSSCGTSPSMDGNSTDFAGTINTGSASPTACTLTFASPFANVPVCVVSDDLQTSEPAVTTRSATAITLTLGASLSSGHIFYICVGQKG